MITIKALVMIIGMKFMIENMFYSLKLFRTSFEVSVFKILKSLLNLFQIDDPKNEMVFWPKLLYFLSFKGILKNLKKTKTLWPIFMDGVQMPQG